VKLSIIIPCYNAEKYLPGLLECLDGQIMKNGYNTTLTDKEVEVFLVDDGSKIPVKADYSWAQVFRKANEGPGIARNVGLDHMTGDYFTFIDADDMVSDNYLQAIFDKIDSETFDYCYISWKSMPGGWQCSVQLKSVEDKFPGFNLCVWNRVYKTATFGKQRFNPKKLWSEDADFIYRLNERGKKSFISEYLYFYRSDTPDSWTKRMMNGELDYTRIVYNIKEVKPDDKKLLAEIKKEYEDNEIVLLTDKNGMPELERYCMIMKYNTPCKGTILRGDHYDGFMQIEKPITTQVVVYISAEHKIGGIETFVYNFCYYMHKYYDIIVLYDALFEASQMARLLKYVPVVQNTSKKIICDTVINCRIVKKVPANIKYKKSIQMSHTCRLDLWHQTKVPQDLDETVFVSEAAAQSFSEEERSAKYKVIHNMTIPYEGDRALLLISATRPTPEKGMNRMLALANMLNNANIPFIWLYFSVERIHGAPDNLVYMTPTLDIMPYIKAADYLVQLSDSEAFCYSIIEALEVGTAIISTPLPVLDELEVKDGEHGYIVPFEVEGFDCKRLLEIPKFYYKRDNAKIIKQWRAILGKTKPKHQYKPGKGVSVRCIKPYRDLVLNRMLKAGEVVIMSEDRAEKITAAGYGIKEA